MNSFHLASSILRGKWLIEPAYAESQGAIIANFLNRYTEFEHKEPDEMMAFAVGAQDPTGTKYSWSRGFDNAPHGSIAVVRIQGALMKMDQSCGPIGTETIGQIIKEADSHPNIAAIVLQIDSPGGTVDGTEVLANIVKNLQKPSLTFVDGMMCSAALWIGSSTMETMASTTTDEVGSVGVLSSFADIQPYWESLGIKFHTITASTSPDKVKIWQDVRAGKYDQYIKEVLDVYDKKFMDTIRSNRPNVKDEHLTGKVYFAKDVMGVFVDSIGTIEDAIMRASELASSQNSQGSNGSQANLNNQSKINMSKKYSTIQKVLGYEEGLEFEADGSRTFSIEEMDAMETALADNSAEELQSQLDTANANLQTANNTIAGHEQTITNLNAQIDELKGNAAETPATAVTKTDDTGDGKPGPVVKENASISEGIESVSQEYLGKSVND